MTSMARRAIFAAALAFTALPAGAHDYTVGDIAVGHPWTRAAGANGNGAGFLTLRNTGSQPDRLVAVTSAAARRVEMHTMTRDGDVMRMRPVQSIPVPAGQTVELRPGGYHIMMVGLTAAMEQGTRVPLTLRFERAGEVEVELAVEAAGARGGAHQH